MFHLVSPELIHRPFSQTDVFIITSPNVGMMQKIKLRSSGSGLGAAWHLARVTITSTATGETLPFPYNNWIDKEHGLEKIIWPDRDGDGVGDVDASLAGAVKYIVNVYTSDIRWAVVLSAHALMSVINLCQLADQHIWLIPSQPCKLTTGVLGRMPTSASKSMETRPSSGPRDLRQTR